MNVHLVDGTYELFRHFFGNPKRRGSDGAEVGALRGLVRSLTYLLNQDDVSHVAVAFDHVIESFRNDLFDGYKTGAGLPEELESQFWPAEDLCRAMGVVVWPLVEFEADDGIAAGAARYAADDRVETVYMATPDKDLGQCVRGTRVVMLDRMRRKVIDEEGIKAKFGVPPSAIPDYLALVGDDADGIPGIPRWGAKSTGAVLTRYGHIEHIPESADDWDIKVRGAKTLADNLAAQREDAMLYRTLATLREDVPIAEELDDLKWRGADAEALAPLLEWIRDPGSLERLT
ncbi:MAG: flap endonuclease [Proteobacteria bacterium]|nr:flap endonuclease [Pseudomonadota bacterium]